MPVKTRSQLEVNIDFDYASKCWRENKNKLDNGCYKYICMGKNKNGLSCRNIPINHANYCKRHLNLQ